MDDRSGFSPVKARDLEPNRIIFVLSTVYQVYEVCDMPVGKVFIKAHPFGRKNGRTAVFINWEDDLIYAK